MARILVNNAERTADTTPNTWGELLDELDCASATSGHIVTAARFDGVEEPSFRDALLEGCRLDGWQTVEVQTDAPRRLLAACLADVASGVGAMRTAVLRLADLFRGADVATASAGLSHVADDLRALMALVNTLRGPVGVDLASLRTDDQPVPEQMQALERDLNTIVQAQVDQDWLTVADALEYDLEPSLGAWERTFTSLAALVPAEDAAPAQALS